MNVHVYIYIYLYQCKVHRGLLWGVGVHIFIFRLTNRLSQSDYLAQHGLGQPFIVYIYIYIYISTESVGLSCTTWAGSALHSIHIYIYTYRLSQSHYVAQHGLGQPFIVYIYIYTHID